LEFNDIAEKRGEERGERPRSIYRYQVALRSLEINLGLKASRTNFKTRFL